MPQFDLANFVPQLAWLALFFAILYFAIVRPTLPKLDRVTDERESRVSTDLGAAESAKATADMTRESYEKAIAAAHSEAQAEVAAAKAGSARELETRLKALSADLDAKDAAAQAQIGAARQSALAEIDRVAGEAASAIVERLTGRAPKATELASALTAAQQG